MLLHPHLLAAFGDELEKDASVLPLATAAAGALAGAYAAANSQGNDARNDLLLRDVGQMSEDAFERRARARRHELIGYAALGGAAGALTPSILAAMAAPTGRAVGSVGRQLVNEGADLLSYGGGALAHGLEEGARGVGRGAVRGAAEEAALHMPGLVGDAAELAGSRVRKGFFGR